MTRDRRNQYRFEDVVDDALSALGCFVVLFVVALVCGLLATPAAP